MRDLSELVNSSSRHLFWAFILLHISIWTLLPAHFHPALPMDVIEGLTWVQSWDFGYYKHPPLTAWVLGIWKSLFGTAVWSFYLLTQLCVAVAFWAVWRLGREILPPPLALLAVLLLEGVFYYNFESTDFNPNTAQLPLWPLVALAFYWALKRGNLVYWALLGLLGALTVLTKYTAAILFVPMLLFLLFDLEARRCWRTPGPYLTMAVMAAALAPHVWWLVSSDFPTFEYAINRAGSNNSWTNHLKYPFRFLLGQSLALLPLVVMGGILAFRRPMAIEPRSTWSFDHRYVLFLALGPVLAYFVISGVMGIKIRTMWATPLWPLAGIAFVLFFKPELTPRRIRWFAWSWIAVVVLTVMAYSTMLAAAPFVSGEPSRGQFKAEVLAQRITESWRQRFGTSLPYVVGRTWLAGSVALHSEDRPKVFIEAKTELSPSVDIDSVREKGAVLVWDAKTYGPNAPGFLSAPFSQIEAQSIIEIPWERPFPIPEEQSGGPATLSPQPIGWAIASPTKP